MEKEKSKPTKWICVHFRSSPDSWSVCAIDKTQSGWSASDGDCADIESGCEEYE